MSNAPGPVEITAARQEPEYQRDRRRQFVRALADLLEQFRDVAETEGPLELDGGQWKVHRITRGN